MPTTSGRGRQHAPGAAPTGSSPGAQQPSGGTAQPAAEAKGGAASVDGGSAEGGGMASWACGEAALMAQLRARDPSGIGLQSVAGLRLLRSLLAWDPASRPSASQALNHAYFTAPGGGHTAATSGAAAGSDVGTGAAAGGEHVHGASQVLVCAKFGEPGWC